MGTPLTGREILIGLKKAAKAAAGSTTVDADSAAGQKVLNVAATTDFAAGETVKIGADTAREEYGVINTIQAGESLTLHDNLTYTHTLVQADPVVNDVVWRYAHPCGAGDGILIKSESVKQTIEELLDDSLGLDFIQRTDPGKIEASGALEAFLRYEGLDVAIALAMGVAGTPSQQGGTAAWANAYTLKDDLTGYFATLAMLKKSDKVFEYPSVKLHGFKISGEMNAPLTISLSGIANKLVLASTINTAATMAAIDYPDKGNRIIFNKDATFKMNDKSGAALDDSNKIYPASVELTFARQIEGDLTAGHEDINEPDENNVPEAMLTLNFPRYNDANHAFFTDWEAFTEKKMEIYFKGPLIATTYYYELKISMPCLKVINPDAAIGGPGKIPATLSLRLLGTDTAPEGMTGITLPFQIDVQNKRTTDPLA